MERKIAFERVKRVMLENVSRIVAHRACAADATRLMIAAYLDDGTILGDWFSLGTNHCMKVVLPDAVRALINGCDVRCVPELVSLLPRGADNRIPGWVYDGVSAYMDPDTGEWMLEPGRAA